MDDFLGDIPNEVFEAHNEGRLVFFCGAGISVSTGLPDWKDLTKEAFDYAGIDISNENLPEKIAIKDGKYDKALHILELKHKTTSLRKWIIGRLTKKISKKRN